MRHELRVCVVLFIFFHITRNAYHVPCLRRLVFYHNLWNNAVDSDFTTLEAWIRSHKLMLDIYNFIKLLPADENIVEQIN